MQLDGKALNTLAERGQFFSHQQNCKGFKTGLANNFLVPLSWESVRLQIQRSMFNSARSRKIYCIEERFLALVAIIAQLKSIVKILMQFNKLRY